VKKERSCWSCMTMMQSSTGCCDGRLRPWGLPPSALVPGPRRNKSWVISSRVPSFSTSSCPTATLGPRSFAEIRNQYPVIVLTGYGSIPNAVSAIREGAADFLTKPVNVDELELTVRRVLETAELRESNQFYRTQTGLASARDRWSFESTAMREVQTMINAVAPTDTTVLILGESGTGKEMVAQAIHERSPTLTAANWSPLMEAACRKTCSNRNFLVTSAVLLPARIGRRRGLIEEAAWQHAVSWMKLATSVPLFRPSCCESWRAIPFRRLGGNKTLDRRCPLCRGNQS
jgi:CheY-like chemotaxis protein